MCKLISFLWFQCTNVMNINDYDNLNCLTVF